ncbi:MAG TPA: hypothetical protein PKE06_08140 [Flavilitoribacter sp.]|nr:hypothetical protein [Flavilitoribacter sp.]HMQ86516.1 hypothetical protein [Flavilitoribacter sp.]
MAYSFTITSSKDIRDFTDGLSAGTPVLEIAAFLKALGKKLKGTNRHNMPPNLVGDTESFILKIQEIFVDSEKNLRPNTENLLFDVIGYIQELTQEIELEGKLKANFYSGIPKLGVMLQNLASYLGTAVAMVSITTILN